MDRARDTKHPEPFSARGLRISNAAPRDLRGCNTKCRSQTLDRSPRTARIDPVIICPSLEVSEPYAEIRMAQVGSTLQGSTFGILKFVLCSRNCSHLGLQADIRIEEGKESVAGPDAQDWFDPRTVSTLSCLQRVSLESEVSP